jgi:hypothetical protein
MKMYLQEIWRLDSSGSRQTNVQWRDRLNTATSLRIYEYGTIFDRPSGCLIVNVSATEITSLVEVGNLGQLVADEPNEVGVWGKQFYIEFTCEVIK